MKDEELMAHIYASIFNYPLTQKEAKLWRIKLKNSSREKMDYAKKVTNNLQKIPFIEAVFITGSSAAGNAKKTDDIDLMIITSPNTLWLTRLLVVVYLKYKKIYKRTVCPNIFLDTDNLEIKQKNLFTAHEVLQAKCLFDRSNIAQQWIAKNEWAKEYLPGAYTQTNKTNNPITPISNTANPQLDIGHWTLVIGVLELLAFIGQYLFMKSKMTNESVGWGYAFFHPRNLSKNVIGEFSKKLRNMGIMEE